MDTSAKRYSAKVLSRVHFRPTEIPNDVDGICGEGTLNMSIGLEKDVRLLGSVLSVLARLSKKLVL